jgi:TonB family protein
MIRIGLSFLMITLIAVTTACLAPHPEKDTSLAVLQAHVPDYPTLALLARIEGRVNLRVWIGQNGEVTRAAVMDGHPLLNDHSLAAAGKWRFNGDAAGRTYTLTYSYVILPKYLSAEEYRAVFRPPGTVEIYRRNPLPYYEVAPPLDPDPLPE